MFICLVICGVLCRLMATRAFKRLELVAPLYGSVHCGFAVNYVVRSRGQISTLVTFRLADDRGASSDEDEDEEEDKEDGQDRRSSHSSSKGKGHDNGEAGAGAASRTQGEMMEFVLWGVDNCVGAFVNHHPEKRRRNVRLIRTSDEIQTVQQLGSLDSNYLWFQACQAIQPGTELFCDYGSQFFSANDKIMA